MTRTVKSRKVEATPSLAVRRTTYSPIAENEAAVDAEVGREKVTEPGPESFVQARERAPLRPPGAVTVVSSSRPAPVEMYAGWPWAG